MLVYMQLLLDVERELGVQARREYEAAAVALEKSRGFVSMMNILSDRFLHQSGIWARAQAAMVREAAAAAEEAARRRGEAAA